MHLHLMRACNVDDEAEKKIKSNSAKRKRRSLFMPKSNVICCNGGAVDLCYCVVCNHSRMMEE